jgi:DNA-binding MarR family transcriptional regulator
VAASKRTALRIGEEELATWRAFLVAYARVVHRIEAALRQQDLPPLAWYDVLWPLYRAPDGRLRMNELADHVVLSRTGLVRLVDRIETAGLLRREPVPGDARGAYAVITDGGTRMLRRMWPVYASGIREHFLGPVARDRAALHRALERMAGARGG